MNPNTETEVELLNLPNKWIDFNSAFLASCALGNQDILIDLCHEYCRHWFERQYSLHELATYLKKERVSLWTAPDVDMPDEEMNANAFAFYMRFDGMENPRENEVLIHCHLQRQEALQ